MSARLAGRVVIVTGGARGMGAAHVRRLTSEAARVVFTDLRDDEGRALAAELGDAARYLHADVASEDDWEHVVRVTEETFGPATGLVNNAAVLDMGTVETTTAEQFRRVTEILQVGVFFGMRAVVPGMRRAGGGSIVNVSATGGLVGFRDILAYAAAKWAVRGMTKCAALELAPDGIRVNSVHPGEIDTPMVAENADTGVIPELDAIPLGRLGRPDEVASLAAFLISAESSYVTGAEHVIDGGYTAQ